MKLNWGHKIAFIYSLFAVIILFLVFRASGDRIDLVTNDYYARELKFQDRIDENKRTNALNGKWKVVQNGRQLEITYPGDFAGKKITGDVQLYYAADATRDVNRPVQVNDNRFSIALPEYAKGTYRVNSTVQVDGVQYYFEETIQL